MKPKTATNPRRQRTHVMVTMSDEQRARIEAIAKTEDRSMTSVCRRLVLESLERLEKSAKKPARH
ncbi:hypothetical protein [Cellvibrio mixtus]|uniref:hypothetical protein n=1 Tax=Cellvibrio mixtus TaxID=39650 RepID=UPI0005865083|nr:hypothetical protein [Cellvibrio mixtus]